MNDSDQSLLDQELFDNGWDCGPTDTLAARDAQAAQAAAEMLGRPAKDAARPDAVRGRYNLAHPVTGVRTSFQRVTRFVGLSADTFHLDLWKQRCVAKGIGMSPNPAAAGRLDVKADKARLDRIVETAKDVAGANVASARGTELHKSAEDADFAGSWQDPYSILKVVPDDRPHIQRYLDTLRASGLKVASLADGSPLIERVAVSTRYDVAGKFDRILTEPDGSHVMVDLKTKDTLDFGVAEIAAQLAVYQDGVNEHGVYTGTPGCMYDTSVKVRADYGLVIHLPQNGTTCTLHWVDLHAGHEISRVCLEVRQSRKIKPDHIMRPYSPSLPSRDEMEAYWIEQMNAAADRAGLMAVRDRARSFGQWTERLAGQARVIDRAGWAA